MAIKRHHLSRDHAGPVDEIIPPTVVDADYGIPVTTQYVWACHNRYGWRDLVIKRGSRTVYRRSAIEAWLASRQGLPARQEGATRSGQRKLDKQNTAEPVREAVPSCSQPVSPGFVDRRDNADYEDEPLGGESHEHR